MARKKDLGGLAALAGLAYMASRDKASKGEAPMGDDQYNPDVKQRSAAAPDMGEIRDDDGTVSKLRRSTDDGALYDPTGSSMSAPSRPAAIGSKAKASTESKSKAPVLGLSDPGSGDAPEAKAAPMDVTKLSLAERAKLSRERARSDGTKTDSRSVNERMRDTLGMKKGGSVKGWGIARGSRKAKNY
jgi:hypothetical protein